MVKRTKGRTSSKVLLYLAKKGEGSKWEISQGLKKAYSNVHSAIKELLKSKLIEIKRKRRSVKNPKIDVEYYGLTFSGLFAALRRAETWRDVCEIAEHQRELLPLVFGKWRHFRSTEINDEQLFWAMKWVCNFVSQMPTVDYTMWGFSLYIFQVVPPPEKIEWLKAIRADPELLKWALEEEKAFHAYATMMNETFKLLREPQPEWEKALEKLRGLQWRSYKASFTAH